MTKKVHTFPGKLIFDTTKVGFMSEEKISKVVNISDEPVEITIADIQSEDFTVKHDTIPTTLNPFSLTHNQSKPIANSDSIIAIESENGFIFLGSDNGTLTVMKNETVVAQYTGYGIINSISAYGDTLFIARKEYGVTSFKIQPSGALIEASTHFITDNEALEVFATNTHLYVAYGTLGIAVFGYTQFTGLIQLITINSATPVYSLYVDYYIYAACGTSVRVLKFDGSAVVQIATQSILAEYVTKKKFENIIFVSDSSNNRVHSLAVDMLGNLSNVDYITVTNPGKLLFDREFLFVCHSGSLGVAVVGVDDDNTMEYLFSVKQANLPVNCVLSTTAFILFAHETTGNLEFFSKNDDYYLDFKVSFDAETDGKKEATLFIYSDAEGSPDIIDMSGIGLGNAVNGIKTINYKVLSRDYILSQYKED